MTEPHDESWFQRFFRLGEPGGRDIAFWAIISIPILIRLADGGDQVRGWRLGSNIVLLAFTLGFGGLAAFRLWKYRGTPSPDECPACGHEWIQHSIGYDVNGVCGGCALDIEYGVPVRVSNGCRLTPPLKKGGDPATEGK